MIRMPFQNNGGQWGFFLSKAQKVTVWTNWKLNVATRLSKLFLAAPFKTVIRLLIIESGG